MLLFPAGRELAQGAVLETLTWGRSAEVCMESSASADAAQQRACVSKGCCQGWHWGLHLQSAQRGRRTSVMTGTQAACRGLWEALAGHIPGIWEATSEGEGLARLGSVKRGLGLPTNHPLTGPGGHWEARGARARATLFMPPPAPPPGRQ